MTDEAKSAEPLPCPFCGGKAQIEDARGSGGWSVGCSDYSGDCYGYQSLTVFPRKWEAIAAWNRRARLSPGGPSQAAAVANALFDALKEQNPDCVREDEHTLWLSGGCTPRSAGTTLNVTWLVDAVLAALTPPVGSEAPVDPCASHKAEGIHNDPCCPACPEPVEPDAPPSPGGADGLEPVAWPEIGDDPQKAREHPLSVLLREAKDDFLRGAARMTDDAATFCARRVVAALTAARPPEAAAEIEALRARVGVLETALEQAIAGLESDLESAKVCGVVAWGARASDRLRAARQALQKGEG